MILFRLAIALLTIQSCSSQSTQWVVTHHEGWDSGFNQYQSDIGLVTGCQRPNYQIIRSNPYLQKTISLRNFKPFAHSLVVIDYLRPQNMDVQIQIQNKTYDPKEIDQMYERQIIDDCLVGDIEYIEQTFAQEIFGNQIQELHIVMIGGKSKKGEFTVASDQKIAIKQIHILQLQCPEFCKRCVHIDNEAVCTQCNDGFETHGSSSCTCNGFNQDGICVEKCYDGYSPDFYDICQNREIIKTINAQQNLRKSYRKDEPLELEFDLESYKAFELDVEVQIYNFDQLQIFQFTMNDGLFAYYLNIDAEQNAINFHEISYRDCESEQFCQIYHFKSKILQLEQSKLNLQVRLIREQLSAQQTNEQQNRVNTYWKLVNLNINVLMIQNEIPYFEHCSEIAKFGFYDKCIKCQAPYVVLDGECVEKCPLQSLQGEDICFDSNIQNTQVLQLDVFNNKYQYLNERYWFYNEEPLISLPEPKPYSYEYLKPHYGISIQTKILFIDENSKLNITLEDQEILVTPRNKDQYNQGNQNKSDPFVYLNYFIPHNDQNISIQIQSSQKVRQSYITNTVLLIHQCTPYCKSCNGPKKSDCLEFATEHYEFNAIVFLEINNLFVTIQLNNAIQDILKQKESIAFLAESLIVLFVQMVLVASNANQGANQQSMENVIAIESHNVLLIFIKTIKQIISFLFSKYFQQQLQQLQKQHYYINIYLQCSNYVIINRIRIFLKFIIYCYFVSHQQLCIINQIESIQNGQSTNIYHMYNL